jgi:ferredoxin
VADVVKRTIGDLRIVIERDLCVGFAQCVDVAEEAFVIDDDEMVGFLDPEHTDRQRLIEACKACPVEALRVFDQDGNQLVP